MTTRPKRWLTKVALTACWLALGACDDDEGLASTPSPSLPATHVQLDVYATSGTTLGVLDKSADALQLFSLDADTDERALQAERVALPDNPSALHARRGASGELLVRCMGLRGVDAPMQLVAVSEGGQSRAYELPAPFTALEQSEDGRFALLRFTTGAPNGAFAPALLSVVDLESDAEPVSAELLVGGAAPDALWLTPALTVGEHARHFALASGPRELALLDLEDPDRAPVRVTLSGDPSLAARVTAVAFDAASARIAVLAEGLDDAIVLELQASDDAERGYTVRVMSAPAGSDPITLAFAGAAGLLVLADDGRALYAVDVDAAASERLALRARASAIETCDGCAHALLHAPFARELTTIELTRLADAGEGALAHQTLAHPVADVLGAGESPVLRLLHEAGAVTLLDLERGELRTLALPEATARAAVATADGSFFVAAQGSLVLTHYDASTRALHEVLLRAPIAGFALAPSAGAAVVLHDTPRLAFTLLSDTEPSFAGARYLEGAIE